MGCPAASGADTQSTDAGDDFLSGADATRASQPNWSSPLTTTTALLEQRLRFDVTQEHSGNGTDTTVLDSGRGVDFIVGDTNEIQLAPPAYDIRTGTNAKDQLEGFSDGTFLRVEQRLTSSAADGQDYALTAWLAVQAPSGIKRLSGNSWAWEPTLAAGKGWGNFDIQGTIGGILPSSHTATLGQQLQTNIALQYEIRRIFWPELELNWTYYPDGQRAGLSQIYLTSGVVIGRVVLFKGLKATIGAGYQWALSPRFRDSPLTPSYAHAFLCTSRLNF
jgi:hypothetical protein